MGQGCSYSCRTGDQCKPEGPRMVVQSRGERRKSFRGRVSPEMIRCKPSFQTQGKQRLSEVMDGWYRITWSLMPEIR